VRKHALALLVALSASFATHATASPRLARGAPKTTGEAGVDRKIVGVGDIFLYSISVTTDDDAVSAAAPSPGNTDGFDVLGSGTSSGQTAVRRGGVIEQRTTITITYKMRAKKIGTYSLGPGQIKLNGAPVSTPKVSIEVVAAGTAPAPKKVNPSRPFDDLDFDDEPEPPPAPKEIPASDPMAAVESVPTDKNDRHLFARIAVDDANPVVGAQVTAKLFVYRRRPAAILASTPGFPDFHLVELPQSEETWHPLTIGGELWEYGRVKAFALFPLRSGALTIPSAQVESKELLQIGVMSGLSVIHRSPTVTVTAREPPLDSRPAGYTVGDVASSLEAVADVNPKVVTDGHAVFTLRLRGLGRIEKLHPVLPTIDGAKLTPTGDDSRTTYDGTKVRGVRKVFYDVALERLGDVDLGDAFVHVWDPAKASYVTLKASLGSVRVEALPPKSASSANELQLPPPRKDEGPNGEGSSIADRVFTWGIVGGAPLAVLALQGGLSLARRAKRKSEEERETPASNAKRALADARSCEKKGDDKGACTALMRAIDRALEAASGVRSRGVTRGELGRALDATSLPRNLAQAAMDALHELESARFAEGERPSVEEVRTLVDRLLDAAPKPEERA